MISLSVCIRADPCPNFIIFNMERIDFSIFWTRILWINTDKNIIFLFLAKLKNNTSEFTRVRYFLKLSNTFLLISGLGPKFSKSPTSISVAFK